MKKIGILGIAPIIAASIVLFKNNTPAASAKEGATAVAGASPTPPEVSDPIVIELGKLKTDLEGVRRENERLSKENLELLTAPGGNNKQLERAAEDLGKTILELLPNEVREDEGVFDLATRLITDFAPTIKEIRAGKYAGTQPNGPVEGGSAILTKKNGKPANESVYVIGVSAERKEAVLYSTPPRIVPLGDLKPVKRGHPITREEQIMREKQFPGVTWDARKD